MKKLQEKLKQEFIERMKGRTIIVSGSNWSLPLDEYLEQERWLRKPVSKLDKIDKVW